jgi:hypothetical protein
MSESPLRPCSLFPGGRSTGKGLASVSAPQRRMRCLTALFFVLAAVLTATTWLRPPLSPDLSGLNLPLRWTLSTKGSPEQLLHGPRRPFIGSLGGALLVLIGLEMGIVLWRPQLLSVASGLLLCGALAANAAVLFNYPDLIELLDLEQQQRQNMVRLLLAPGEPPPLATVQGGRDHAAAPLNGWISAAPVQNQESADLFRAWAYTWFGPFLIALAALGLLLAKRGPLSSRLICLAGWSVAGAVLAGVLCWPRLWAEYHWHQAVLCEGQGDYVGARTELDASLAQAPQFARLQRTWLLLGKLDHRQHRSGPALHLLQAYQQGQGKHWAEALAQLNELPVASYHDWPAVAQQAARLALASGLDHYQRQRWAAAERDGQLARVWVPQAKDARLLLAVASARQDIGRPGRVEELLGPLLGPSLADQMLRADCLSLLGNVYFTAGQMSQARQRYAESLDAFSLPRPADYRAEKGLGGL